MTTMATETRAIAPGDTVEWTGEAFRTQWGEYPARHPEYIGVRGVVTNVTGGGDHIVTVEGDVPDVLTSGWGSGRWRRVEVEAEPEVFRVGSRVRLVRTVGGMAEVGDLGTVTRMSGDIPNAVRFDGRQGGAMGGGEHYVNPGTVELVTAPHITVGARVRVSNPAYSTAAPGGYVGPAFYGSEGIAESESNGTWEVRVDGVGTNYIHPNYLTVISGGSDESAAADTPVDENEVRMGDHVSVPSYSRNGRVIDAGSPPARYDDRRYVGGIASVLLDTGEETRFYGTDIRFQRHDDSPIDEIVNEREGFLGKRVWSSDTEREGVVVTKAGTEIPPRYKRSNQWLAVVFDGDTTPTQVQFVYLALRPDTPITEMDDAAKLRALQVMIHRVASYEAVRREWCNEVNTALRGLGDLLPPELRSVNRTLGAHLRSNPQELFMIDQPVPVDVDSDDDDDADDEPEPIDRSFSVEISADYDAEQGFGVRGACFTVDISTSDYTEDDEIDTDMIHDMVENLIGERGLVREIDGSDLPTVSGYNLDSWEITDYTEQ